MSNSAHDVILVSTTRVACDGGGGALGHPKTYLDMGQGAEVICKYCGRVFRLNQKTFIKGPH